MWKNKKLCILLVVLLFCWLPSICLAETVSVGRQDLTQLKVELTALQQNNEQLATNWEQSEQALVIAEEQLTASNNRILTLKQQLTTLELKTKTVEQLSRTAEKDLNAANQLLTAWKKEQDNEIAKIKRENKVYKLVLIGLAAKMFLGK